MKEILRESLSREKEQEKSYIKEIPTKDHSPSVAEQAYGAFCSQFRKNST